MSKLIESTGNTTGRTYYYQLRHEFHICGTCGVFVDEEFLQIHTDWHDNGN